MADTSVWIDYFKAQQSAVGREMDSLLVSGEIAVVGLVVAEVLQGAHSPAEFDSLREYMSGLRFLDDDKDTWIMAGQLANGLRNRGRTIPLSDVTIAVVAMQHDEPVLTTDRHFEFVPGLRLHPIGT